MGRAFAEGHYVGSVPALKGCHSQAKSLDELMVRIREAINLCLEAQADEPVSTPDVSDDAHGLCVPGSPG